MLSLRLFAFALPVLAGLVEAAKNPSSNIAFVSFPASYNDLQKGSTGAYHGLCVSFDFGELSLMGTIALTPGARDASNTAVALESIT